MKRALVLIGLLAMPLVAQADCVYARTAYKDISCKAQKKEKEAPVDVASSSATLPGLEEAPIGPLDELTCDCTYVLRGSNPFCDSDREQEFSQTYPQDPSTPVCLRAKSLCASVCPRQLP